MGKNIGKQIKSYTEENKESLPMKYNWAFSKRLAKVPLRLSVIAQQLQQWDLTYTNPAQELQEKVC